MDINSASTPVIATIEPHDQVLFAQEMAQKKQGDYSMGHDCLELPIIKKLSFEQNDLPELRGIWNSYSKEEKKQFAAKYGQIGNLLIVPVEEALVKALVFF